VGIYWQRYGWVAPGEEISGLEDEYRLSGDRPKLIYVKTPALEREVRLKELLGRIQRDDEVSYKPFSTPRELKELLENDLALLLTERFEATPPPPAPPVEPPKPSLPLPPTPLIGRERELADLAALLQSARLVTLVGPGGIGKSRLALELALKRAPQGSVYFAELSGVRDPALVVSTLAGALGVHEVEGASLLERLKGALREKETLLLLDNFEHLLAAAPVVSELLAAAPGLKVLVTSREALRLAAEHEFPVPPLALPPAGAAAPFADLKEAEAVRLFVERARAVKPSFALSAENAPLVAEIVRRLDCLPLAIELAAACIRLFPPRTLLQRLDRRFDLLTGGARDLPNRQRTLRNTIDWSFNLLQEDEKTLLTRLAVFAGGCTLEALGAVCNPGGALPLEASLAGLVDKNLVVQEEWRGEGRFKLLESVRAYVLEKLAASGEAEGVRARHAEFFLTLAEAAEDPLMGGEQVVWLDRLEVELDNLRAALAWSAQQRGTLHARLATVLTSFWWLRGHFSEGRGWLAGALERLEGGSKLRAKALNSAGTLAWLQGDYAAARTLYEEALAISRALDNAPGVASALGNLGIIAIEGGDYAAARARLEEGLQISRGLNDPQGVAPALINLAIVFIKQGDYAAARTRLEEALAINRGLGNRWGVTTALLNLGEVMGAQGEYAAAQAHFEESLALAQELGDRESLAYALEGFASVAAAQGRGERAARLWGAAEALRDAIGNFLPPSGRINYDGDVAEVHAQLGEAAFQEAWREGRATPLEEAVRYALEGGTPVPQLKGVPHPKSS